MPATFNNSGDEKTDVAQGGSIVILEDHINEVTAATFKFGCSVLDPKAAIIVNYVSTQGTVRTGILGSSNS